MGLQMLHLLLRILAQCVASLGDRGLIVVRSLEEKIFCAALGARYNHGPDHIAVLAPAHAHLLHVVSLRIFLQKGVAPEHVDQDHERDELADDAVEVGGDFPLAAILERIVLLLIHAQDQYLDDIVKDSGPDETEDHEHVEHADRLVRALLAILID